MTNFTVADIKNTLQDLDVPKLTENGDYINEKGFQSEDKENFKVSEFFNNRIIAYQFATVITDDLNAKSDRKTPLNELINDWFSLKNFTTFLREAKGLLDDTGQELYLKEKDSAVTNKLWVSGSNLEKKAAALAIAVHAPFC